MGIWRALILNMMDRVGNFKSGRYEVYGDLLPQAIINNNFNYFKK